MEERIVRWGRVPRMVLGAVAFEKAELQLTPNGLEPEPLRKALFGTDDIAAQSAVSYRVAHYQFPFDTAEPYSWAEGQAATRSYRSPTMQWASRFMQQEVFKLISDESADSNMQLLSSLGLYEHTAGLLLPVPAATNVPFSTLPDVAAAMRSGHSAAQRFVAPDGFPSIDFVEAQLRYPCGSNATVSSDHSLIVQAARAHRPPVAGAESCVPPQQSGRRGDRTTQARRHSRERQRG